MDGTTTTQAAEQQGQSAAAEQQGQQPAEAEQEKAGALQKFIEGLFGGKKPESEEPEKSGDPSAGSTAAEKAFTQADLDAAIEAEKKKWEDAAAEAERVKGLTPEQKLAEEQAKRDSEIADLKSRLMQKELREKAAKELEKNGFPAGLADVLDYSDEKHMEESLQHTTAVFKESLASAVMTKLKGKTPEGLGGAAASENLLRDQIARNIRGL